MPLVQRLAKEEERLHRLANQKKQAKRWEHELKIREELKRQAATSGGAVEAAGQGGGDAGATSENAAQAKSDP